MLLNLVDKHWTGEQSLHHNNNFLCEFGLWFVECLIWLQEPKDNECLLIILFLALAQAVQILSMMENDISSREAEVRTLRREADALSFQAASREDEHKSEVRNLSDQLEEARSAVVSGFNTRRQCWALGGLDSFDELTVIISFSQTQAKLNEQLRIVLEENVGLQKQLIKLERQYLKSMMKSSPISQIKGGCVRQLEKLRSAN